MIMLDITAFQNVNICTDDIAGETNPVPPGGCGCRYHYVSNLVWFRQVL